MRRRIFVPKLPIVIHFKETSNQFSLEAALWITYVELTFLAFSKTRKTKTNFIIVFWSCGSICNGLIKYIVVHNRSLMPVTGCFLGSLPILALTALIINTAASFSDTYSTWKSKRNIQRSLLVPHYKRNVVRQRVAIQFLICRLMREVHWTSVQLAWLKEKPVALMSSKDVLQSLLRFEQQFVALRIMGNRKGLSKSSKNMFVPQFPLHT